ncbi:MAG: gliding motility protein GldN [Paludibacteraceae bacterium]|nr:gliding motility protein GldN [Paludibacteraceae bacterium]
MIKKVSFVVCLLLVMVSARAQHQVNSFFDELGTARIQTADFSPAHDTIVLLDHRLDDVIWSRYVYRIIDMRYKQNFQLYFPTNADDPEYRNLFHVIVDAVKDGMPIYEKGQETIKPDFKTQDPMERKNIPNMFLAGPTTSPDPNDTLYLDVARSNAMMIRYDAETDELSTNYYPFDGFVRNQIKYLIQEIVFFDKHTSRLHTKIIGIAPLRPDRITKDSTEVIGALNQSIMFWIPFDALRPYMAMQYVIPNRNETKRVTFDEFFQKRLFTSYIVGEGNMYNRWIPDYSGTPEQVRKEQDRIASELLNFEQDLWEY